MGLDVVEWRFLAATLAGAGKERGEASEIRTQEQALTRAAGKTSILTVAYYWRSNCSTTEGGARGMPAEKAG